ncbi:MAG: peptide chain release factor N(5)-glutamine methyltransferase [Candidatus Omnitrophota bacterium]|jgi:release factor glutamine methyltransferase
MNEAELLFSYVLQCSRPSLYLDKDKVIDRVVSRQIAGVLKRRIAGEPLQYILGEADFMGYAISVSPDVLIPRPETEILVETVIKIAEEIFGPSVRRHERVFGDHGASLRILDIGTGSGCIAVSLAKILSGAALEAVEVSPQALRMASRNAVAHNVTVNFIESDLFASSLLSGRRFDIIVSNPPYIPSEEIKSLQPEIYYEPCVALDGGADGLDFFRRIIADSPEYLKTGGFLIMEMGYRQSAALKNILQNSGKFEIIEVVKDYSNIDRVVVARKII